VSISNNTGSLPDLTNINFPSPLSNPLDGDGTSNNGTATAARINGEMASSYADQLTREMQQQQPNFWIQQQQQQQNHQQQHVGMNRQMIPEPLTLHGGGSNHLLRGNSMVSVQVDFTLVKLSSLDNTWCFLFIFCFKCCVSVC